MGEGKKCEKEDVDAETVVGTLVWPGWPLGVHKKADRKITARPQIAVNDGTHN